MTMTTRKRHSPEQVMRKLVTADRMLGEGNDVADVCRELGVSEQTYYRWRNQFSGLKADDAKRLKVLERERSGSAGPPHTAISPSRPGRPLPLPRTVTNPMV
jgi:putative transposase